MVRKRLRWEATDGIGYDYHTERVPEGQSLDPEKRARLEAAGFEEFHVSRVGWFAAQSGTDVHFRKRKVAYHRPIRWRGR
jgi:hypothetical protein